MRKTMTTIALMAAVGMAAPAFAQQGTNERDRDTTPTRTTQPGTTGQNDQNRWQRDDENRDGMHVYRDQDYFGRVGDSSTDLGKLSNLAGVWRITVKHFHHGEGNMEGTNTTSTGYAERRWILDGTKLVEVYTLDGTPNDLPLRALNAPRGWNSNNPMDAGDWDRDNLDRNNTNREDWDGNDRTPGQTRPGSTSDNTTGTRNTTDRDGETSGYLDKKPEGDNTPAARPGDQNRPGDLAHPADRNSRPGQSGQPAQPGQDNIVLPSRPAENIDPNSRQPVDRRNTMHKMSGEDKGMVLWGYNPNTDEFNVVWTDAATSAIRYDTGKMGDDNRLELKGQYVDPRDNKEYKTRTVIEITSPTMQKVTMYRDGGLFSSKTKVFEITYTKDSQYDSMNHRDGMQDRDGWNNGDPNNNNNNNNNRGSTPRTDRPGNDRP